MRDLRSTKGFGVLGGLTMELYDVVMRLNGQIEPAGDTRLDADRLENLKSLCNLVWRLVSDIDDVAMSAGEHMASVKAAKDCATEFLRDHLGIAE